MQLTSNIFAIDFTFDKFQIQRLPWKEGLLDELRTTYNEQYSFFRNGDFIYISPSTTDLQPLGEVTSLSIEDNIDITSSLIKHIFFRGFKSVFPNIKPTFYPFTFPSRRSEHDLITDLLPDNLKGSITYRKLNEVYVRHAILDGKKGFTIVLDSSYKWAIRGSCLKLKSGGMSLEGLEVAHLIKHHSSSEVAAPSFEAIGTIKSTDGLRAIVETNDGDVEHELDYLYLNKTKRNIEVFLEHFTGRDAAHEILEGVRSRESQRNDPQITYQEIQRLASEISKIDYHNGDGFCFHIQPIPTTLFPSLSLELPKYLFDVSFTKADTSPSRGLNKYGPYDFGKFFEINSPNVLVVYHKNSSGAFTQFLGWLKDGLPNSTYFQQGLLAKYRLTDIRFHCVEIESYSKDAYLEALKKAYLFTPNSFDIAIIETKEEFKKLPTIENPYWYTKAFLLQKGIAAQYIKEYNARNPEYIIDSCALQAYAKLGGTPWVLPASQNIAHEIIVGIGSAFTRENLFKGAKQNRIVGITTFFNADGRYLLSNRTREVSYSEYFNELLHNLTDSITRISEENGWQNQDIVRIVFHVFKPMKNVEVDVVSQLISNYPQYDIKFAFITFSDKHPYMLFDLAQMGIPSRRSTATKGKYIPSRGTNILLEDGVCLLQLKGPSDIKSDRQGYTSPLLIKVHPKSTFLDITYLVHQVYRLTNISYRTFSPSQLPVSLFYASLITEQLNKLSMINGWNVEFLRQLRHRKWFI